MTKNGKKWLLVLLILSIGILMYIAFDFSKAMLGKNEFFSTTTLTLPPDSLQPFATNFVNYDTNAQYSLLNNVIFDSPDPSKRSAMVHQINSIQSALGTFILSQMTNESPWILFSNAANFGGTLFFIYPTNGKFDMTGTLLPLMNIYNGNSISYYIPILYTVTLTYDKTVPDIPVNSSIAIMQSQVDALSVKSVTLTGTNTNYTIPDISNIISMTVPLA